MPWTKTGDSAATHPKLMATAAVPGADERIVNEVAGWISRCGWQSAAHMTDYIIDVGTAWMLGGSRTQELVRICERTGLLTETTRDGLPAYQLVNDPEFIHIRLKAEIEWERQQGKDTRDASLTVHVRRRDGDQCRWCKTVVQWRGRGTNRTGTIDHLDPGLPGTVETMVVACKRCNSSRQDNPQWVDDHPLLDAPGSPLYGKWTAEFLTDNGYPTDPNIGPESRDLPARPSDPDTAREQPHGASERPGHRNGTATPEEARQAPAQPHSAPREPQKGPQKESARSRKTTSPGSGRDGTGSGQAGYGSGQDGNRPRRRRRGRRGGRKPTTAPTGHQPRQQP